MGNGAVIWSTKSEKLLKKHYNFIAKDSKIYALRFISSLIEYTEEYFNRSIIVNGRLVPEFKGTSLSYLREIIYKGYRIIYSSSADNGQIYIVMVISGRMNIENHLE